MESDNKSRERGSSINRRLASLIALADDAIVVEDGTITEFGSVDSLKAAEGYIAKLQLKAPSNASEIETLAHKEPSLHVANETVNPETFMEPNDETQDLRRQTGDLSVYTYYSKAGGHGLVALMLVTVALWVFCTEFSSMLSPIVSLRFNNSCAHIRSHHRRLVVFGE